MRLASFLITTLFVLLVGSGEGLSANVSAFVHPGGLHNKEDLARMKVKVAAKEHPWIDGWEALIRDPKAKSDYRPGPHPHMASRQRAQDDANAAYLNSLRWWVSGEKDHAECARRILNAWAETVKEVPHGTDQPGLSGIPIGTFAIAGETLRDYPGWSRTEQSKFGEMLLKYFYPVCNDFLTHHNGRPDSSFWANWDACNMRAILAIGVYCDDRSKFNEAVDYYKNGRGTGSIKNAVPFVHPNGLGQWQESGRDQAHVMGGQGLLAEMCQIAWNQGVDLFGYDGNKLLAGGEYTAQYTLWKGVPYTFYTNADKANQYYVSENYHGRLDTSHFELLYNHYVVRGKLKAPNVGLLAGLRRPEPGEIDVLGYGTLTYTLDAKSSPLPDAPPPVPRELAATGGLGRIEVKWSPSGAYTAHGYEVCRSLSQGGPYESVYSVKNWTTPFYEDTKVEPGKTYFYTVAALNNAGKSEPSGPATATVASSGPLPEAWSNAGAGTSYSDAAGGSFVIPANGRDLDGNFVGRPVEGDLDLTARLLGRRGPVSMMGLTVREGGAGKSKALAMTLGETGGRQARFRTRGADGKTATQLGNDYTWLPVWLRFKRAGDVFTAYQSSDGIIWHEVGKSIIAMPKTLAAGLLASAGNPPPGAKKEDMPQASFDHVAIEPKLPGPPAAPTALTVSDAGKGTLRLEWKNVQSSTQAGIKVEASIGGAPFCEVANLAADATHFENTGIKDPATVKYRLRSYNRGGYSGYSAVSP